MNDCLLSVAYLRIFISSYFTARRCPRAVYAMAVFDHPSVCHKPAF